MGVSPFDDKVLMRLLGDEGVAKLFGTVAECAAAVTFETALARATAAEGFISEKAAETIADKLESFTPDLDKLAAATARDGVMVPGLVAEMRAHIGKPAGDDLHFGATSQDVLDTALVLRLREALKVIEAGLTAAVGALFKLEELYGDHALAGVTRMQDALPITVGDRLRAWRSPLVRHLERIEEIKPRLLVVQFGGPVGTLDRFGEKGRAVAQCLADELGLGLPEQSWHSQRDALAEFAGWLSLVSGALGKIGQDVALMAQNAVGEVQFTGGGGSSAMPHKHNPVKAEVLVALAQFNAAQLSAMHQALVHENERSGAMWTLEWLVLPQMVVATAGGLRCGTEMLGSITTLGHPGA